MYNLDIETFESFRLNNNISIHYGIDISDLDLSGNSNSCNLEKSIESENDKNNDINFIPIMNKNSEKHINKKGKDFFNTYYTSKKNNMNNASNKIEDKKERIFKIEKNKNKYRGRNKKNKKYTKKKQHNKHEVNNIIMKIKRKVLNYSIDFINKKLKNSKNNNLKRIRLKKLVQSIINVHQKGKNIKLLESQLKDILSNKLSLKYKDPPENYNKIQIEKILKENDSELNEILNKTFEDIVNIYALNEIEKDLFKGFRKIENDKEEMLKSYENDGIEYFNEYENVAQNLKTIIHEKREKQKMMKD